MHISALALTLCAAAPATETPQEPGLTMIIAGPALMAAGIGLEAAAAYPIQQNTTIGCIDCLLTLSAGNLVALGGGALVAGYGWKLGEWDAHEALANGTTEDSPYAVLGWVFAGLGMAARTGGQIRTGAIEFGPDAESDANVGKVFRQTFIADAVTAPLLGIGAYFLGYSLGYDSVIEKRTRISVIPSTRGIHVVGMF